MSGADVVFECRGEASGQKVIDCRVRGHGWLIKRRCRWLREKVEAEERRRAEAPPTAPGSLPATVMGVVEETEDDTPCHSRPPLTTTTTSSSSVVPLRPAPVTVSLPRAAPDAFKVFLEYLYTNRALPLGYAAHHSTTVQPGLCELDPDVAIRLGGGGAVVAASEPWLHGPNTAWNDTAKEYSSNPWPDASGWPAGGACVLDVGVVLGVLGLAVDARLKRLARMCEVAASELLGRGSASEAVRCVKACAEFEGKGARQALLEDAAVAKVMERDVWRVARGHLMGMEGGIRGRVVRMIMCNVAPRVAGRVQPIKDAREESRKFYEKISAKERREREKERQKGVQFVREMEGENDWESVRERFHTIGEEVDMEVE